MTGGRDGVPAGFRFPAQGRTSTFSTSPHVDGHGLVAGGGEEALGLLASWAGTGAVVPTATD
ncbi:hypothetical protein ABZY45_12910 [Streptomyces sp. NPDC006516]|uniref:hypothetical protein n=1 Tax=Streptomyces sp. NPDC006516 TaxID=3154309 RepID=UPI0033ACC987